MTSGGLTFYVYRCHAVPRTRVSLSCLRCQNFFLCTGRDLLFYLSPTNFRRAPADCGVNGERHNRRIMDTLSKLSGGASSSTEFAGLMQNQKLRLEGPRCVPRFMISFVISKRLLNPRLGSTSSRSARHLTKRATNKSRGQSRVTASCDILREIAYTSGHDPTCFERSFWTDVSTTVARAIFAASRSSQI